MKTQTPKLSLIVVALLLVQKAVALSPDLEIAAKENRESTYIAAPAFGNVEPTLFEASLAPAKFFTLNSKTGVELTFKVVLRMLNQRSCPIQTPSYMPSAALHRVVKFFSDSTLLIAKFMIGHHSNGQDGEFFNPEGEINTINGNFATDYLRFSLIRTIKKIGLVAAGIEQHVNIEACSEQAAMYGLTRLQVGFQSRYIDLHTLIKKIKTGNLTRISLTSAWIAGKYNSFKTLDAGKRFLGSVILSHKPSFSKGLSFFVQYYYGQDYYNINFSRQLSFCRVGFSIQPNALLQ